MANKIVKVKYFSVVVIFGNVDEIFKAKLLD